MVILKIILDDFGMLKPQLAWKGGYEAMVGDTEICIC
jgi:hypothetical protein